MSCHPSQDIEEQRPQATLSTHSELHLVASGHHIRWAQPALVATTIQQMVGKVRLDQV